MTNKLKQNIYTRLLLYTLVILMSIHCSTPNTKPDSNYPKEDTHKVEIKPETTVSAPFDPEERPNTIGPWNITTIAPKVIKIVAIPPTLTLKIGQILDLKQIKIYAYDKYGNNLGEVWGWSTKYPDFRLLKASGDSIIASHPGEFSILAIFPTYGLTKPNNDPPNVSINIAIVP